MNNEVIYNELERNVVCITLYIYFILLKAKFQNCNYIKYYFFKIHMQFI